MDERRIVAERHIAGIESAWTALLVSLMRSDPAVMKRPLEQVEAAALKAALETAIGAYARRMAFDDA